MVGILTTLYLLSGIASVASYLPLIYSIFNKKESDQNIYSWLLWFSASIISVFYASLVVKNLPFLLISIGHLLGTMIICFLVLRKTFSIKDAFEC